MNTPKRAIIKRGTDMNMAGPSPAKHETAACIPVESPAAREQKPKIVLHRQDELIEAIELTCPCGHTMIIECEYPS